MPYRHSRLQFKLSCRVWKKERKRARLEIETSGPCMLVNYDSRVISASNLQVITTLES